MARFAIESFQRHELHLLDHSRPVPFTSMQHILNWLGVYTFEDKVYPAGPLDLRKVSHVEYRSINARF